jgi:hypothetical protein
MADETPRGQGTRAEAEAQRRRRRGDETLEATKRLPIPPDVQARLDRDGLVTRWVNDEGNRMHRFTVLDDYDPVEGVEPVPVGTDEAGKPILAHLLAKRREFVEEDRARAEDRRSEREKALFRNPQAAADAAAGANPDNPTVRPGTTTYVDQASKISRNQLLGG